VISKQEIIDAAAKYGLTPHVVEKDYVLGWLLAGIANHEALSERWVFKGGTCLKKCFFETYRFSEDLDFTLKDSSHLDADFLSKTFAEIAEWVTEESGISIPHDLLRFDLFDNPRGNLSCQGRVSYQGPVSPTKGGLPRVKLDLTADEKLVLPPVHLRVFHPYSDEPKDGIYVTSYAYEEAFGEKFRALGERTRPRDLYDVVNLFRHAEARPSPEILLKVLREKCEFKGIEVPTLDQLTPHKGDLEAAWENMLRHQLPQLPSVETFWDVLPEIFQWLQGGPVPASPQPYQLAIGEAIIRERRLDLGISMRGQTAMEVIRFAAANRLCVVINYRKPDGVRSNPRIEPYSLRRTQAGDIILHAYDVDKQGHRSYRVDRIDGAQSTNQSFTPRYEIELTPTGTLTISDNPVRNVPAAPLHISQPSRRSSAISGTGPTYIYECSYCGKKFRRKSQSPRLNKHKDNSGYPCSGRMGYLADTRY